MIFFFHFCTIWAQVCFCINDLDSEIFIFVHLGSVSGARRHGSGVIRKRTGIGPEVASLLLKGSILYNYSDARALRQCYDKHCPRLLLDLYSI